MTTDHRPQLDTLRFLAFLAVFLFHLDERRFAYGWIGVPLFFVLSGFLITRILLQNDSGSVSHDLRIFYIRRGLRIFPVYYLTLLVLLALGVLVRPIWYFTYLMNVDFFLTNEWPRYTVHLWSLCVEEQFYLLFPPLLLLWPRRGRLFCLVLLLVGSWLFRLTLDSLAAHRPDEVWRNYLWLFHCGEYLLWGAIAGKVDLIVGERRWPAFGLIWLGLALHAMATADHFRVDPGQPIPGRWHQTAHGAGFALIVLGLWRIPNGWGKWAFSLPVIVYLGKISYGLYLFHNFTFGTRSALLPYAPWLQILPGGVVALIVTIGLAMLSWHLVEAPLNGLKQYWPYRRNGCNDPAAQERLSPREVAN